MLPDYIFVARVLTMRHAIEKDLAMAPQVRAGWLAALEWVMTI
jgi:hypothetical protein